jgi:UDP-N-acetylmuramoyl-tripeptide--D-alanyl-D-alanine ligase
VFVCNQIDELMEHSKQQKRLTYGVEEADFTGGLVDDGIFVSLRFKSEVIHTRLIGEYNFNNILVACAIGDYFKISIENIRRSLEKYTPSNNRSQLVKTERNTLILDAYNANPTSMEAALRSFAKLDVGEKFFIIGDMLELGCESLLEHQRIFSLLQKLNLFNGVFVGKIFQSLSLEDLMVFKDAGEVRDFLQKQAFEDHTILIKGSRGISLESIIDVL